MYMLCSVCVIVWSDASHTDTCFVSLQFDDIYLLPDQIQVCESVTEFSNFCMVYGSVAL